MTRSGNGGGRHRTYWHLVVVQRGRGGWARIAGAAHGGSGGGGGGSCDDARHSYGARTARSPPGFSPCTQTTLYCTHNVLIAGRMYG